MASNSSSRLYEINAEVAHTLIPVITIVGCLCFIGVIGNPLVIYFYGFKLKATPSYIFIVALACSDMVVCVVAMPMEIVDMLKFYTFESSEACKVLRFVNYLASITSCFFLLTIAVDRYRKICRPFQKQISNKLAGILVLVDFACGLFLAWPNIIFYAAVDVNVTEEEGIVGHDCTTIPGSEFRFYILLYNIVLIVAFLTTIVALSVLYGLVGKQLFNLRSFRFYASKAASKMRPGSTQTVRSEMSTMSIDIRTNSEKELNKNYMLEAFNAEVREGGLSTIVEDDGFGTSESRPTSGSERPASSNSVKLSTRSKTFGGGSPKVAPENFNQDQEYTGLSPRSGKPLRLTRSFGDQSISPRIGSATSFQFKRGRGPPKPRIGSAVSTVSYGSTVSYDSDYSDDGFRNEVIPDVQTRDARATGSIDTKKAHAQNINTRRYTIIMMSITIAFVLSFLPYLSVFTWSRLTPEYEPSLLNKSELVAVQLFVRSWLINGSVNPLIYGFLNTEFRQFIKGIFSKICCCCCRKKDDSNTTVVKEPSGMTNSST